MNFSNAGDVHQKKLIREYANSILSTLYSMIIIIIHIIHLVGYRVTTRFVDVYECSLHLQ